MFIGQPSPVCRQHDQRNCSLGNHRSCLDLLRGLYIETLNKLKGLKNKQGLKFLFRHYGTRQRTQLPTGFYFWQLGHILFCHSGVSFYRYIDILVYILFKLSKSKCKFVHWMFFFNHFVVSLKYLRYTCTWCHYIYNRIFDFIH